MARYVRSVNLDGRPGVRFNNSGYDVRSGSFADGMGLSTFADELSTVEDNAFDVEGFTATNIQADGLVNRAIEDANTNARIAAMKGEATIEAAENNEGVAGKARSGNVLGSVFKAAIPLIGSAIMSDETTKNSIEKINKALDKLRQLRPVSFYYNKEYSCQPERLHYGFVAQEFQNVMPDATYYDDEKQKYCIDLMELIGVIVSGIQELDSKVKQLESNESFNTK